MRLREELPLSGQTGEAERWMRRHPSAVRTEGGILELEGKELGIRDETIELEQGRITIFIQDEHGVGI